MASIVIIGPTGVGKSDIALEIAARVGGEIVNADSGQMYAPLTIGTAKPIYQKSTIPHHCFDVVTDPVNYSSAHYNELIRTTITDITARSSVPIIVGGSGFYIKSLFFPPHEGKKISNAPSDYGPNPWELLNSIDPVRSQQLHRNDIYRIHRALDIWYEYHQKPSQLAPVYDPCGDALVIFVTRDRADLYQRIDDRVIAMIDAGWIEEVESLRGTAWESFLKTKKIIGYDIILEYLDQKIDRNALCAIIQKKTRNYAKQQIIFWKSFKRQLTDAAMQSHSKYRVAIQEINLTLAAHDLYINQLLNTFTTEFKTLRD